MTASITHIDGDMTWAVISSEERVTTYKGRHFTATRIQPLGHWSVHELVAIAACVESSDTRTLIERGLESRAISQSVRAALNAA